MMFTAPDILAASVATFLQVVLIDVALAGDNAVAVGMAAAGLPAERQRTAIILGLGLAVMMRIAFALIAVQLLNIVGLLLAGGVLLLWVCWKMWRELREQARARAAEAAQDASTAKPAPKTLLGALVQILVADVSMSLDNVLGIAGAARQHPTVLVFGLLLSITLMGVAATWVARLLQRWSWIGYVGLAIVLYVSAHMIWEGHRDVVIQVRQVAAYNQLMPDLLDIKPAEIARKLNGSKA
jgi:YjbE family integral membrane protein